MQVVWEHNTSSASKAYDCKPKLDLKIIMSNISVDPS